MVGAPQGEGLSALGHGQYGWPECKEFQAFGSGQGGRRAAGLGFECLRAGSVWVARMQGIPSILGGDRKRKCKQGDMQAGLGADRKICKQDDT